MILDNQTEQVGSVNKHYCQGTWLKAAKEALESSLLWISIQNNLGEIVNGRTSTKINCICRKALLLECVDSLPYVPF